MLLVDDNPLFLEEAGAWLSRQAEVEVVGTATSASEGLALAARLRPRVVLMDVALPGLNGIEATRRLKLSPNAPAVLILTLYGDAAYRAAAAAAGAEEFLCKSELATELLPSLRRICRPVSERGEVPE